jgi:cobyrinic acid a,c-diamide synthase
MKSIFISAAHKSSGKTTVSIGLSAATAKRGIVVQPFKKGPDYIDPIWLGMAAGRPCYTLDYFTSSEEATVDDFKIKSQSADMSIIEGNKGLYDGLDLDGSNSNAALAKSIDAPVILVIDVRGTMRGIAPLLIGYESFDTDVRIAGVIASMSGGERHESKLRAAVEHYTDIPFLGSLRNNPSLIVSEQHLGLIPSYEDPQAQNKIINIRNAVNEQIDIDQIIDIAQLGSSLSAPILSFKTTAKPQFSGLRIGIAQDRAFGFYYSGDLDAIRETGASLIAIDTLEDKYLPDIDGLFIGGGFPERHANALQKNVSLRQMIKSAIEAGLPTYAECGGMMYLSEQLSWQNSSYNMVGAIPGRTTMHEKPCGRGYVKLEENQHSALWPGSENYAKTIHAHEFHYSSLDGLPEDMPFVYSVKRGTGIDQQKDGLIYKNLLASYTHLRNTDKTPWVNRFLSFVQNIKLNDQSYDSKAL